MGIPLRNPPENADINRADQRRLLSADDNLDSDDNASEADVMELHQWKATH